VGFVRWEQHQGFHKLEGFKCVHHWHVDGMQGKHQQMLAFANSAEQIIRKVNNWKSTEEHTRKYPLKMVESKCVQKGIST